MSRREKKAKEEGGWTERRVEGRKCKVKKSKTGYQIYIGTKMADKSFEAGKSHKERFGAAAKSWGLSSKSIKPVSKQNGCSRCRYSKTGCLGCDPEKKKRHEEKHSMLTSNEVVHEAIRGICDS